MKPGETINKWTFLAESPDRPKYGIFRCKCGKIKEVNINTVIKGKSKGCKNCQRNNTDVPNEAHKKLQMGNQQTANAEHKLKHSL